LRQELPILRSLDEAYLDVTDNLQGIPLARDIAICACALPADTASIISALRPIALE